VTEETIKPSPEIQALIDKAAIPAGANFEEAYQRLLVRGGLKEEEALRWAQVLTAEKAA